MSNKENFLTQEYLKSILEFDSEKGTFTWKVAKSRSVKVGTLAGTKNSLGYHSIRIDKVDYLAHRLAWFYTYNIWPSIIDHIDRNRSNNKLSNLRDVSQSENIHNSSLSISNKTGYKGVSFKLDKGVYTTQCTVQGKAHYLGCFKTAEEASAAYSSFVKDLYSK